ncbi:hypothetical protein Droror1_Dr00007929 [Drosera rotundifolia]
MREMAVETVVIGIIPEEGDLESIEHYYNEAAANILRKPLAVGQIESALEKTGLINRVDGADDDDDDLGDDDYRDDGDYPDDDDSPHHANEPWVTDDVHAPESPRFGQSVFDIPSHQAIQDAQMESYTQASQSNNKMALVVADTNLSHYGKLFRELGYSVCSARDINEAANHCIDYNLDVVLIDIRDGSEVAHTILTHLVGLDAEPIVIAVVADNIALWMEKPQYTSQKIENVVPRFKVDKQLPKLVSGGYSKTDEDRVLVITDNTVNDYELLLDEWGYDATMEFNKDGAVNLHWELPFDVIILDIKDGHEVANTLPDKSSVIGVVENSSAFKKYDEVGVENVILRCKVEEELRDLLRAISQGKVAGLRRNNKRRALAVGNKTAGYQKLLENLGYDVTWVPDVDQVFDILEKHHKKPFELAVLDVGDEGPGVANLLKPCQKRAIIGIVDDENDANLKQYIKEGVTRVIVRKTAGLELKKAVTDLGN